MFRVDFPDHDQAILRLGIVDGVPAERRDTNRPCDVRATPENLLEDAFRQKRSREAHQIQGKQRPGPHRIDVGEGIGRCDPTEVVWIVDDGREEVRRYDQRTVIGEAIHRRIVAREVVDQDVWIFDREHVTQNLRQLGHAEFTRSTGAMTELGQPDFRPRVPRLFDHAISSLGVCGCLMRKVERKHGAVHG